MEQKWLESDESVILEGKAFIWISGKFTRNGTWALLYLTNKRLYVKDRIFRIKLLEFPYPDIKSVESDDKTLKVTGYYEGKGYQLSIRLKDIDEMWESMIRGRMR